MALSWQYEAPDEAETTAGKLSSAELIEALKAAGDPTRLRLLMLCRRCELSVSELTWIIGQSQPRVSRHLKVLCDAGLLNRYAEGTWVMYRLALQGGVAPLGRLIDELLDIEEGETSEILERLEEVRNRRRAVAQSYFSRNAEHWSEMTRLQVSEREVETALHAILGWGRLGDMLDLGTGTGRLLAILAGRAETAIGVDINSEMLGVARQAIDRPDFEHVQVRQADIRRLPYGKGSFDLITAHQVLHYLDDPDVVVREAARVLRPGGRRRLPRAGHAVGRHPRRLPAAVRRADPRGGVRVSVPQFFPGALGLDPRVQRTQRLGPGVEPQDAVSFAIPMRTR
jgi:ArsR family transcriptional regulator